MQLTSLASDFTFFATHLGYAHGGLDDPAASLTRSAAVFPENVLFDFVLLHLEEEISGYIPPASEPLPCDRWLARSALQKAIRRGEPETALKALATLLDQDRYAVWRHLTVIALEDVGVAAIDTVSQVIAAGRNRPWRKTMGGEWAVASFLVRKMAHGQHCQAACDLLLKAINSPSLDQARADALDAELSDLLDCVDDASVPLEHQAVVTLALGGGLSEEQRHRDPDAVFSVLAGHGYSSHVVATCRAAWRTSRNPMALLLPLVRERWMSAQAVDLRDDAMPSSRIWRGIPDYAIDQFTRIGGQVARAYLACEHEMQALLDAASIPRGQQPRTVGDLLFLNEGGLVRNRVIWAGADMLRLPHRQLPGTAKLGFRLNAALQLLAKHDATIAGLRSEHLHRQLG